MKEPAPVQLTLRGRTLTGNAIVLKPESDSGAILEGLSVFLRRFPAFAKVHHIRIGKDGHFSAADLQQAAKQAVIIRVELG